MTTLSALAILTLSTWNNPTSNPEISGMATYYRDGLMQQVAHNRHMIIEPPYLGGVALNRAGDLGRTVWLKWQDGSVDGPYRVVDCATRGKDFLRRENKEPPLIVEVDAETARRRGFYGVGPVPVTVLFGDGALAVPAARGRYVEI